MLADLRRVLTGRRLLYVTAVRMSAVHQKRRAAGAWAVTGRGRTLTFPFPTTASGRLLSAMSGLATRSFRGMARRDWTK